MSERIGIVGGGVLGMTLALRLAQRGHRVSLFDGAAGLGGLAAPHRLGRCTWDRFYHVILLSDTHLLSLLRELDLEQDLRWGVTRTGVFGNGKLHSLSTTLEFLTFPLLSLTDKARLAGTILRAARITDGQHLEAVPVSDWLIRWSGRQTFERLWLPLLKAKLGDNYRIASASFIWAIIARMYAARRSGLKREMFGYVDGGYAVILARLRARLEETGVTIYAGSAVTRVDNQGASAQIATADGLTREFDRAVLTVSCGKASSLCPALTDDERARLARPVYQGVVCASLLLRRPLGGFYVTNITDDGFPFTAVIEMTALVDRSRFDGHTLVYLPRYLAQDDPFWSRTDRDIQETFLAGLGRMYPGLSREDVLACEISRVRDVLAISTLNYTRDALPPVSTTIDRVYLVNSAQIANGTLNVNETIKLAETQIADLTRRFTPARSLATA